MQRVTIKDVARLAGVSITTVSRALNHSADISEETRERILRICQETGYHTNLLARSLISSKTNTLGLSLPGIASPFYSSLALNIETYARENGYQVMLCSGRPGDGKTESLFEYLISQQVDGILLSNSGDQARELVRRYQDVVPTVLLGASVPDASGARINSVSTDNYSGGRIAAEYLYRLGHRDVVYLGLRPGSTTHAVRHRGFITAAQELGMTVTTVENTISFSTIETGYQIAQEFFSHPFTQTALFAPSDPMALGAMQVADELGIAIPERLSVLGFDNMEYAAMPGIRLTTIAQNTARMGRAAVRLLLELGESNSHGEYTHRIIQPALVERATCRSIIINLKTELELGASPGPVL